MAVIDGGYLPADIRRNDMSLNMFQSIIGLSFRLSARRTTIRFAGSRVQQATTAKTEGLLIHPAYN